MGKRVTAVCWLSVVLPLQTAAATPTPTPTFDGAARKAAGVVKETRSVVDDVRNGRVKAKIPDGVPLVGEVSVDLGLKGGPCGTMHASADLEAFVGVQLPKNKVVSAKAVTGMKSKLETIMSNDAWKEIRQEGAPFPWPFRPETMVRGSTVILREELFQKLDFKAAYKGFRYAAGVSHANGDVVAVTRLMNGSLRITTGPYEIVSQEESLGFEKGPIALSLGKSSTVQEGSLTVYEFAPGEESAFLETLTEGPQRSGRGGDVIRYASGSADPKVMLKAGPFKISKDGTAVTGGIREVRHQDGSKTVDFFDRRGNVAVAVHQEYVQTALVDAKLAVVLHNVDDARRQLLGNAFGVDPKTLGDEIVLPLDGWQTWRDAAKQYLRNWEARFPPRSAHPAPDKFFRDLAAANSPWQVANLMKHTDALASNLSSLRSYGAKTALASKIAKVPVPACTADPATTSLVPISGGEFFTP